MSEKWVKPNRARVVAVITDNDPTELARSVMELTERIQEVGEVQIVEYFEVDDETE